MPRAAAFVRYDGADGTGHIGWAFDVDAQDTDCGAVEDPAGLPSCDPAQMGFWETTTPTPVALMLHRTPAYDALKYVDTDGGDAALAQSTVAWVATQPYTLFGRNCMDDVYDVLRAFGIRNLPPPVLHWFPNNWFDAFEAILEPMTFLWRPVVVPEVAPHALPPPAPVVAAAPAWRVLGTPEWHDLQAQMAAQSGFPSIRQRAQRFRALRVEGP